MRRISSGIVASDGRACWVRLHVFILIIQNLSFLDEVGGELKIKVLESWSDANHSRVQDNIVAGRLHDLGCMNYISAYHCLSSKLCSSPDSFIHLHSRPSPTKRLSYAFLLTVPQA